jgi:hypothetical protein
MPNLISYETEAALDVAQSQDIPNENPPAPTSDDIRDRNPPDRTLR